MYEENIQKTHDIISQIKKSGLKTVSIGFSTGKDSLAGYDIMVKNGIDVIPVYFYIVPGIKFIEENIKMYEDYYNMHIIRLPHLMMDDYINYTLFQPLHRVKEFSNYYNITRKSFTERLQWFFNEENIDCKYDANCMKMSDSINRRLLLRSTPDIDHKKKIIYIGKYLTNKDCWQYIKENNIPLTRDYEIFGRSADDLMNYQYLSGIKCYYPDDYELIKEYFPLVEVELLRYEAFIKRYKFKK